MTNTINQIETAQRIRFVIDRLRISQASFARRLGLDPGNLSKHLNGKLPITKGLVNRIALDLGVSRSWLTTGEGVPFSKEAAAEVEMDVLAVEPTLVGESGGVPVYDIDVTAGCLELSRELTTDRIIGSVRLPGVQPNTAIVRVNGDSMQPTIPGGAYIAIREISNPDCIFWGHIYVVVTDDYRMVKYVKPHLTDPTKLVLKSDNPFYDDMVIPRESVRKLYVVESVLNLTTRL